jgi:hypothetical protein
MRGVITHMGSSWTLLRGLRSWDRDPGGGRDPGPQIGTPDPDRDPGPQIGTPDPDRDPGPQIGTPDPRSGPRTRVGTPGSGISDPQIGDLRPPDRDLRPPIGVITPSEVFGSRHDVINMHKMT